MKPKAEEIAVFAATLQAEKPKQAPHLTARDAIRLMSLGRRHASASVNLCNIPNYQETYDRRTETIRRKLADVLKPYGAKAITGGDPRGCTVKLKLRSKRTNDFGGEGYCVPGA